MRTTIFNKKNISKCRFASLRFGTWPDAVCQQKCGDATCHIQLVTFDAGSQDFNALNYIQSFEYKGDIVLARYTDATVRFKALAHPVRLQILDMLRGGEVCVCHMEAVLGKRQAYISQQLMVLRDAGLVESRKDGLSVFYRVIDDVVFDLLEATVGCRRYIGTGRHRFRPVQFRIPPGNRRITGLADLESERDHGSGWQLGSRFMSTRLNPKRIKIVFGLVLLGVAALIMKDVIFP
jgi:DNA-binding transcriptional ArsR family regulator